MIYDQLAGPNARGTRNHACLTVPDAAKVLEELRKRAAAINYDREIKIQIGVNRKRQINLYDPDGTRIELMESNTVDGQPAPNSTAPAPILAGSIRGPERGDVNPDLRPIRMVNIRLSLSRARH